MKKAHKLFIILIFIISVVLFCYYNFNGIQIYKYDIIVGNHIGFNLDNDMLHFGTVPKGENSKRSVVIRNTGEKSKVRIKAFGEISDFIYASDNNFILLPEESKEITLYIYTNKS